MSPTRALAQKAPQRSGGPSSNWPHRALYDGVIAALHALPARFESPLIIEGVPATDLFTMNTPLAAAIEASVVDSLNGLRQLWDPEGKYAAYSFVRQSQTFPDVLLRSTDPASTERVLMGVELKGWFVIAKEGEPSFRYVASANACAEADLLVVVPWVFDSVISGKPKLLQPIIVEARYAAQMRNYHWEFVRDTQAALKDRGVAVAAHVGPYPVKNNNYSDRAVKDGGSNFGRIARCGVINDDVKSRLNEVALGIPLSAWQRFLSIFSEQSDSAEIGRRLDRIEGDLVARFQLPLEKQEEVLSRIREIVEILSAR